MQPEDSAPNQKKMAGHVGLHAPGHEAGDGTTPDIPLQSSAPEFRKIRYWNITDVKPDNRDNEDAIQAINVRLRGIEEALGRLESLLVSHVKQHTTT